MYNNAKYIQGKREFLSGKPILEMPGVHGHNNDTCDIRSGWRAAQATRARYPQWTDAFILSEVSYA